MANGKKILLKALSDGGPIEILAHRLESSFTHNGNNSLMTPIDEEISHLIFDSLYHKVGDVGKALDMCNKWSQRASKAKALVSQAQQQLQEIRDRFKYREQTRQ